MVRAIWNGLVLAESDDTLIVEGNHYFPVESLNSEHFVPSGHARGASGSAWRVTG